MRICSFQPGATEIIYALGMEDHLVGVSSKCDYPVQARTKQVIVKSIFDGSNPTSSEITRTMSERITKGLGLYSTDHQALKQLKPDLLLTQGICDI